MSPKPDENSLYEQQENKILQQSDAFISLLTKRGILGDHEIDNTRVRNAQQKRRRTAFHNTQVLLQHYRSFKWILEMMPETIAEELDKPFEGIDMLLEHVDTELALGNKKLAGRLEGVEKSRLLIDKLEMALTVLKQKPGNGERLYELIYLTYLGPERYFHTELLEKLKMSSRTYYRLRQQAITILSIRLWAAPIAEVDMWLNDETDYSSVVGKTDGLFPSKFKGRGLIKRDELYEFQLASLTDDEVPFAFIQETCKELAEKWEGETARKIPILPDKVNVEFLSDYVDANKKLNIPVGVEKNSLNVHYYPFHAAYINMIMSAGLEYQEFVSDLTTLVGTATEVNGIVFDMPKVIGENTGAMSVFTTAKECEEQIAKLFELVLYRNNTYKEAIENGNKVEEFDHLFVVINSLSMLKTALSDQGKEKLALILEKGTKEYNINIVLAEQVKNISSVSFEKWYKANVSPSDGLWIGSGITEQYQMKANKTTSEMHEDITPEFGYSLIKGKCVKLKLLNNKAEEEEDDDE